LARSTLPRWTHPIVGGALRAVAASFRAVGLDEGLAVCRDLGRTYARSNASRVRLDRAMDNIRWCFPEWSAERAREVAVESCAHLFGLAAEMAWTPHLFEGDQLDETGWPRRIVIDDGAWPAIDLLRTGQPCILITGHLGNWEVLGATIAHFGYPLHALYRPLNMAPVDRWVRETRRKRGLDLVDKFGALERLPGIIERGESVGFIADQNAGHKGLFVPFFDRMASSYKSIGLLAMQHGLPLLCGEAKRAIDPASRELRYRIAVDDVIRPADWADQPDALFYITARYRLSIERMVRADPEQYLWLHRYWKSRPKWETRGRPMPRALREKIAALPWMTDEELARIDERVERDSHEAAAPR